MSLYPAAQPDGLYDVEVPVDFGGKLPFVETVSCFWYHIKAMIETGRRLNSVNAFRSKPVVHRTTKSKQKKGSVHV